MDNEVEIWKSHPEIVGIEVSTLGRVRTLDKVVSSERGTRFIKGRVLKPIDNGHGYLRIGIQINGKRTKKLVHCLVAQTFIENPDNLPQVNHKNCNRADDRVSNLEYCTTSYNRQYQEKFGEGLGKSIFAVNLKTLKVSRFRSQNEASRLLGVDNSTITKVTKGELKQTGGYWFKEDDSNGIEIDNDKLNDIVDGMPFKGKVFAVNLNTLKVSRFESQTEASRKLGIFKQSINMVLKGKLNQTGSYWFVTADDKAVDLTKRKLHYIDKTRLTAADAESSDFASQVLNEQSTCETTPRMLYYCWRKYQAAKHKC